MLTDLTRKLSNIKTSIFILFCNNKSSLKRCQILRITTVRVYGLF